MKEEAEGREMDIKNFMYSSLEDQRPSFEQRSAPVELDGVVELMADNT